MGFTVALHVPFGKGPTDRLAVNCLELPMIILTWLPNRG